MRRKFIFRRIALVVFVLILVLSMGLTAFAQNNGQQVTILSDPQLAAAVPLPLDGVEENTGGLNEDVPEEEPDDANAPEPEQPQPPQEPNTPDESEAPSEEEDASDTSALEDEEEPEEDEEEDDEEEEEEPDVQAVGIEVDATSVIVDNYDDLKTILGEDNGYTTIYFGDNITSNDTGVNIHPSKTSVVLDGQPPDGSGATYTFNQRVSKDQGHCIRVNNAATSSVLIRNMHVEGGNYYGIVTVIEGINNVTITHENITYTGAQPVYNRGGTTLFSNSSYTLQGMGDTEVNELAETRYAQFAGNVTITATGANNSILWLMENDSTLTLLDGANVTVNTNFYFLYTGGHLNQTVHMGPGSSLNLTYRNGFTYEGQSIASFTMASGASLDINHNAVNAYAALRVNRLFQMDPGSSATIVRTGTAGIGLRMTAANAQVVLNQPQRVFFYSAASVPLRFTGAGSLSITTDTLNVWQTTGWPTADSLDNMPTHFWNKAEGLLTVNGSYNETVNNSLTHNLAEGDPVVSALTAANFNLENSQLIALGSMDLAIDDVYNGSPTINGSANSGAAVSANYVLADGQSGAATGSADGAGRYALPASGEMEVDSNVVVIANANRLKMRKIAVVQQGGANSLVLVSVPELVPFGSVQVPGAQTLVDRQSGLLTLEVSDTRYTAAPWRIDASLAQPLTAQLSGRQSVLQSAIVFIQEGEDPIALNEVPLTVYRQGSGQAGVYEIEWDYDEGIFVSLVPGEVYSGVQYTGAIEWALIDAP